MQFPIAPAETSQDCWRGGSRPFIVGLGGTARQGSRTEIALKVALAAAESHGAITQGFSGPQLLLPLYHPDRSLRSETALEFIDALRRCDGLIIASPAYHGTLSGLVKNALDYVEDLGDAEPMYLSNRAVGCIVCAGGWQAAGQTLVTLRSIAHALRAWPTPFGAAVNTSEHVTNGIDKPFSDVVCEQIATVGHEVVDFASNLHAHRQAAAVSTRPQ